MSKAPLKEPILFNGLALVFILVLLPVSIALVADSAYSYDDENFQNAYPATALGTLNVAFIENGIDYSGVYDAQEGFTSNEADCSYLVQTREPFILPDKRYFSGSCEGDGVQGPTVGTGRSGPISSMPHIVPSSAFGKLVAEIPQTHHLISPSLNHGYIGSSGNSNFSWAYMMNTTVAGDDWVLPNEQLGAIKIIKLDDAQTFACSDTSLFTEVQFDYSLELWYDQKMLKFDFEDIQDNHIVDVSNPGQCFSTLTLYHNLTGLQITEITNHNNNDWYNTTIISRINEIQRTDGNNFLTTSLPFAGIDTYQETFEYITIEDTDVKQGLSTIALALGFAMAAIGLASTQYWNPIVDRFRGFKVD